MKALAPQRPEWKTQAPFGSLLKGDMKAALAGGDRAILEIVMVTHTIPDPVCGGRRGIGGDSVSMIWFYERKGTTVRVETSFDNDTHEYVLRYVDPTYGSRVERFNEAVAYRIRLVTLEAELTADGWHLTIESPVIDPEGFPRTRQRKS